MHLPLKSSVTGASRSPTQSPALLLVARGWLHWAWCGEATRQCLPPPRPPAHTACQLPPKKSLLDVTKCDPASRTSTLLWDRAPVPKMALT